MIDSDCGAVLICHFPPPGLTSRLQSIAAQVGKLVIVDNTPHDAGSAHIGPLAAMPNLRVIANGRNVGIAAALNQGLHALMEDGCRWALLLDHDSTPAADMLPRMLAATRQWAGKQAAVYVPRVRYALPEIMCRWPVTPPGRRYRFRRIPASEMRQPTPVDLAIGSGMLLDLSAVRRIGLFRAGMFIDLVDTEFCLRVRQHGYQVVAVPGAELDHSIGNTRKVSALGLLPVYPTHHAPVRHYYLARNRVHLWKAYGHVFPSWAAYEFLSGVKLLAKSMAYEDDRWAKLRATVRGTWDGIKTPIPPLKDVV